MSDEPLYMYGIRGAPVHVRYRVLLYMYGIRKKQVHASRGSGRQRGRGLTFGVVMT